MTKTILKIKNRELTCGIMNFEFFSSGIGKILGNVGAEFIIYPVENAKKIFSLKEAEDLIENIKIKKLHLISVHGMSSTRSGEEDNCITDYFGKLKNFENIFINDASILPGATGESPQASIMAFAKRNVKNNIY